MIQGLLNSSVSIYRRTSAGRDSLGNPIYGTPTSGVGWALIYSNAPVRLAFSSKSLEFAQTGERPVPAGIAYINASYTVLAEDRILTPDGIEYTVTSVVPGYLVANVIDHFELVLSLP
jgi:hypothetical protein